MSLKVIQELGDEHVQSELMSRIETWYKELKDILSALPEDLKIYWFAQDDPGIMKDFGVGGYAYSPQIMSLGFTLDFEDKEDQLKQLKSTVYHEGLHIAQNYTGTGETTPLIECMIYEGLATIFEREVLGNHQPYGEYPDDKTVRQWIDDISDVKTPWGFADYAKWGFEDPESGEKWRLYKAGTWLIDQILKNTDTTVMNMTKMTANQILELHK